MKICSNLCSIYCGFIQDNISNFWGGGRAMLLILCLFDCAWCACVSTPINSCCHSSLMQSAYSRRLFSFTTSVHLKMAGGGEWCILLHYRQPKLVLYNGCNAGEGFPYYWEGRGGCLWKVWRQERGGIELGFDSYLPYTFCLFFNLDYFFSPDGNLRALQFKTGAIELLYYSQPPSGNSPPILLFLQLSS